MRRSPTPTPVSPTATPDLTFHLFEHPVGNRLGFCGVDRIGDGDRLTIRSELLIRRARTGGQAQPGDENQENALHTALDALMVFCLFRLGRDARKGNNA